MSALSLNVTPGTEPWASGGRATPMAYSAMLGTSPCACQHRPSRQIRSLRVASRRARAVRAAGAEQKCRPWSYESLEPTA